MAVGGCTSHRIILAKIRRRTKINKDAIFIHSESIRTQISTRARNHPLASHQQVHGAPHTIKCILQRFMVDCSSDLIVSALGYKHPQKPVSCFYILLSRFWCWIGSFAHLSHASAVTVEDIESDDHSRQQPPQKPTEVCSGLRFLFSMYVLL